MEQPPSDANTQPASSTGADATQGNPSTAQTPTSDQEYAKGLQGAINKALGTLPSQGTEEPKPDAQPSAEPKPEGDTPAQPPKENEQTPPAEPKPDSEEAPADPAAQGPVPYERFSSVVAEKNDALKQVQEMQPAVKDYEQIIGFLEQNSLAPADFQWALRLAAAKKNSPESYFKMLEPDLNQVKSLKGEALDPDLQAAVEAGELSQAWAAKTQAARATQVFQQRNAEATRAQQERAAMQAYQQSMTSATVDWAKAKQSSDTEFQPSKAGKIGMYEVFVAQLNFASQQQTPRTPEQMKALCDRIYAEVKPLFKAPPKANGSPQIRTSQSTPSNPREIKTLDDALRAGVAKANQLILNGSRG